MSESLHCKDLVRTLSDYVDGELDETLCIDLEKHLSECDNCRVVVDTMRKTIALYRNDAGEISLPEDVRKRLFYCLNIEEYIKSK